MSESHHPTEINRDYIRLLQGMSRFIKEEFSVSIRMTQEDAVELLLKYSDESNNTILKEMAKELRELTYGPEIVEAKREPEDHAAKKDGVRYYRGAPVAGSGDESSAASDPAEEAAPKQKDKPTRVYRGQVIHG